MCPAGRQAGRDAIENIILEARKVRLLSGLNVSEIRLTQNEVHGHLGMQKGCVKYWQREIRWLNDQRKFGCIQEQCPALLAAAVLKSDLEHISCSQA